ncbi:MAG: LPS assembly protein LptD [Alphaproteobacteria bacterium]|nr:LPS assembly protein LptD [Alphaproteobacteria bacterium]
MLRICAIAVSLAVAPSVAAQTTSAPVIIRADEVTHDQELGNVVAKGDVEITQRDRVLFADSVSYNQKSNTVTASGNVIILEPDGDTMFADYVELTDDMRDGVIEQIRVLLADDSRFAANRGRRENGTRTTLRRAVYSPCKVCEDNPERAPLWQLKASTIVHDKDAREIRYQNARLEMYGIPVIYSPYLAHPDPTVQRKSGFLTPSFGSSGNLGAFIEIPYFWAIDKSQDATFSPIYTRDEGIIFSGEYRRRFNKGEFEISGSIAEADRRIGSGFAQETRKDEIRGHIFSLGRYDIDNTWRTGFDIERSTDRSYLRRFNFFGSRGNSLTSNAFVEGFRGRNYAAANTYLYQDLRSGQRPNTPRIAPILDFNHVGLPTKFGGRFSFDANYLSLYRADAADTQRASLKFGYDIPFHAEAGFVTTVRATVQSDLYYVQQADDSNEDDGFTGRLFPQITADWRYPFVRDSGQTRQFIEPIVALVLSPNGSNPGAIPSEDSVVVEIDDTNILSADRFPGLDRVESGQKVIYGMKFGVYGEGDGRTTAFIGQSYRFHADDDLVNEVGIERHLSDIVGRIEIRPNRYVNLLYRFRTAEDRIEFKRNEIGFSLGTKALNFSGNYLFIDDEASENDLGKREEINAVMKSQIDDNWSVRMRMQRDLGENGGTLFAGVSLTYEDECFKFTTDARRSFTRDADFEPSDDVIFRLTFKHLGTVTTAAN